ncbi:MAG: AAC(3) family N-acetyltransferase [Spirochaetaceae bacterium]|nr:AAC(3) family N-acetyltransferase [Spirochaetaceae bacterium]
MSEQDAIAAQGTEPVTEQSLAEDLRALGVGQEMVVLVHSSLSALGWVCGGPVAVIRALLQAVGADGTLVMPAHSGDLSDPSLWRSPPAPAAWWDTIRATMPAFDPAVTPTRRLGVIPELFRTWPGAARSNHPSCSFAALGPQAARIVPEQRLEDPMGEGSPLSAIYELGG